MIGLLAGPFLAAKIGLNGLFYLLAALGFLSMVLTATSFRRNSRARAKNRRWRSRGPRPSALATDLYRGIRAVVCA